MQTLLTQPMVKPERTPEPSRPKTPVEPSDHTSFRDAMERAARKREPDAPPPVQNGKTPEADPPAQGDDPPTKIPKEPENKIKSEGTREVKPDEPNAQANEPDSKPNQSEAQVSLLQTAATTTAVAQTDSVANPTSLEIGIGKISTDTPLGVRPISAGTSLTTSTASQITAGPKPADTPNNGTPAAPEKVFHHDDHRIRLLTTEELANMEGTNDLPLKLPKVEDPKGVDAISIGASDRVETSQTGDASANAQDGETAKRDRHHASPEGHSGITATSGSEATSTTNRVSATKSTEAPIDRELIARQLSDRIELMAATRPKSGVVVMLEPAHLGAITLVVKGDKSDLQAQVYSENDRVREAIRQAHPSLVQHLGQRGVTLTSLAVSTENQTSASLANSDAWKQHGQQKPGGQSGSAPRQFNGNGTASVGIANVRNFTRKAQGVDIWI